MRDIHNCTFYCWSTLISDTLLTHTHPHTHTPRHTPHTHTHTPPHSTHTQTHPATLHTHKHTPPHSTHTQTHPATLHTHTHSYPQCQVQDPRCCDRWWAHPQRGWSDHTHCQKSRLLSIPHGMYTNCTACILLYVCFGCLFIGRPVIHRCALTAHCWRVIILIAFMYVALT